MLEGGETAGSRWRGAGDGVGWEVAHVRAVLRRQGQDSMGQEAVQGWHGARGGVGNGMGKGRLETAGARWCGVGGGAGDGAGEGRLETAGARRQGRRWRGRWHGVGDSGGRGESK